MTALNALPPAFHTLGWQLAVPVCSVIALVGLALLVFGCWFGPTHKDYGMWHGGGIISALLGALAFLIPGGIVLGYLVVCGPQYMKNYEVTGTVVSGTDRFVNGTGDLSYGDFVIRIDSVDYPLTIEDAKATSLTAGSKVTLRCYLGWNYQAHDDYYCKIREFNDA